MITCLIAISSLAQGQDPAVTIASRVLARYHQKIKVEGTIKFTATATAAGAADVIDTKLQWVWPNKFYIRQAVAKSSKPPFLAVSDGNAYQYTHPYFGIHPRVDQYAEEPLRLFDGTMMDIHAMYSAISGEKHMLDRSTPLDIIMNRRVDLEVVNTLHGGWKYEGRKTIKGEELDVLTGKYKEAKGQSYAGTFQMLVTPTGDIRQYSRRQKYLNEDQASFFVDMVWDVDVRMDDDAKIDKALFKLPRVRKR